MLFPTIEFAIFFPIVLGLSWLLMPRQPLWKPFIVVASYVFYAAADPRFCLLLGGITVGNQIAAVLIRRTTTNGARSWICGAAVALDLLVLGVFKYYAFFVTDVGDVLDSIALGMPLPLLTIALPIGISFFTFQAITYVVDVKRGDAEPASLIDAAIYLSFFPHLVAGPIVRASEFLPQLRTPRDPHRVAVGAGLALIGLGLVKKVLIADMLARQIVDPVFGVPEAYFAPDAILATLAYAAQIYCDFSGYTDIAIGLALLLGFIFPQNFHSPYRATGFRDFWRRWHMTLSRFLRDYLYIPLGGSRGSRAVHLPQPDDHDGARRALARRRVDLRALGGVPRRDAVSPSTRSTAARPPHPGWLRWLGTFAARLLRLDPVPLARPRRLLGLPRPPRRPGPATLWTVPVVLDGGRRDRPAAAAAAAARAPAAADRAPAADRARRRPRGGDPGRRRDRAEPGRAAVHLLPVLMGRATMTSTRRQRDEPLRAPAASARTPPAMPSAAVALVALLLVLFSGGSIRDATAQIDPGSAATSSTPSAGRPSGSPTGCRSHEAQHELTGGLSPDTELGGGGFDDARPRRRAAPARIRRSPPTPSTRPRSAPSRRRSSELGTLLVTGDSLSTPLDTELARRLAPDGVDVVRDPHLGTGISEHGDRRLGPALDRAGRQRPARRGRRLHRRQRGLRDARARTASRSSAAGPTTPRRTRTGCAR